MPDVVSSERKQIDALVEKACRFNCDGESSCNCHAHELYRATVLALDAATAERDVAERQCADAERFANDLSLKLDAAEAELARLRAQGTWQPIETAPKDGSVLLLGEFAKDRDDEWDECRAYVGRYGLKVGRLLGWHSIPGVFARNPTHWQPLPAPPDTEGA